MTSSRGRRMTSLTSSSHDKPALDVFPSSRELRDGFGRFSDLRSFPGFFVTSSFTYTITLWQLEAIPQSIPLSFFESFSAVLFHLDTSSSFTTSQQLLRDYYSNYASSEQLTTDLLNASVPSFVPCFVQMRFHSDSLYSDYIILVPITITQKKCLEALFQRWSFILNGTCVFPRFFTA